MKDLAHPASSKQSRPGSLESGALSALSPRVREVSPLWPRVGFLKRLRVYLAAMYPVPPRLLSAVLIYLSSAAILSQIHGIRPQRFSVFTLLGIWSVFAVMLMLRLMDELKDQEVDRQHFSDRPLPAGHVLATDIRWALAAVMLLLLAPHWIAGKAFWTMVVVLGYALLMFRFFFIPRHLRRNLPLTLATHNPVVPIVLFHLVTLFACSQQMPLQKLDWLLTLLFIAMYWALFLSWEVARKIRVPQEETAYITYSQVLGCRPAVVFLVGLQTLAFGIGLCFFWTLSLSSLFLGLLLFGYIQAAAGDVRFLHHPEPPGIKLHYGQERLMLAVFGGLTMEHWV